MPPHFRFKVQLQGIEPPIWRRFLLPESASFADLHRAIQDSCGWEDCHLHTFLEAGGRRSEIPSSTTPDGERDWSATPLDSWFRERGKDRRNCLYWYDFGDDWMHVVELEGVEEHPEGHGRELLAGARAFPPEDCGGVPGYQQLTRALNQASPRDGDDAALLEWLGDWQSERFDLDAERRRFGDRPSSPPSVKEPDEGQVITFAPLPGAPARALSSQAVKLGSLLRRIVMAGSVHSPGATITTGLKCIRRPERRQCAGYITVSRPGSGDEIVWRCSVCTDGGTASGWRDGDLDLGDDAEAYVLDHGEEYSVRIPADVYGALLDEQNLSISPGRLLCSAQASAGQVVLRGDIEEFEELYEDLCADASLAPPGALRKRLDVAGLAVAQVFDDALGEASREVEAPDEDETAILAEATEGLPLTQPELTTLRQMYRESWGLFVGAPGATEGMVSALRELAERIVLDRKIREALAIGTVERRQLPFFLGLLNCTLERVVEFGARFPGSGFELCRGFLARIGEIAERVHVEESELAVVAVHVTQGALRMAASLEEATEALRALLRDLLALWAGDRCAAFYFVPDLIIGLDLGKRDRKWLRGEIQKGLDGAALEYPEEWEELRDRLE